MTDVDPSVMARLGRALAVMRKYVRIEGEVLLFVKDETPNGRHLHAWTYPADALLEGPGGSIGIAFRRESLSLPWHDLVHILAHEVGHAAVDIKAIRRGDPVGEINAEKVATILTRDHAQELEEL